MPKHSDNLVLLESRSSVAGNSDTRSRRHSRVNLPRPPRRGIGEVWWPHRLMRRNGGRAPVADKNPRVLRELGDWGFVA